MSKNHDNVSATMDKIADASPFVAFIVACVAFLILILFKSDYYGAVFSGRWNPIAAYSIGIAAAVASEAARAILLVLTFRDFRNENKVGGFLGLVLSFALVGYDCLSAGPISSLWSGDSAGQIGYVIKDVFVFLVALSAGLELRLALSTKHSSNAATETDATRKVATDSNAAKRDFIETAKRYSASNGTTPNIHNETTEHETAQRKRVTPFQGATQQTHATSQNTVSNGDTGDAYLVQESLDKARNNLRAYKSKLRNGNGNPNTLQRGVDRWTEKVAALEQELQKF